MRYSRVIAIALGVALFASACSDSTSGLLADAALDSTLGGTADALGSIVTAGANGIHLLRPDSSVFGSPDIGSAVTQPTWSRDGRSVVASSLDGGVWQVSVIDGVSGQIRSSSPSSRPYFFYSWSYDGTLIAALGPGPTGTALDILDRDGVVVADTVVSGGSVYVAWEPDGDDLLVHTNDQLLLVEPDFTVSLLGSVGRAFLAPSWIPSSRDALVVSPASKGSHLVRLDVDTRRSDPTAELVNDFGPTNGVVSVVVAPSGSSTALLHIASGLAPDQGDIINAAYRPVAESTQSSTAAVEIVDLSTGDRTPVINDTPFWAEWSLDGRRLLVATFDVARRDGVWSVWEAGDVTTLTRWDPTGAFLQRYIAFADQYVEQPRLWAPDGSAFAYAARNSTGSDTVFVMGLDPAVDPVELDSASVGFWSPG